MESCQTSLYLAGGGEVALGFDVFLPKVQRFVNNRWIELLYLIPLHNALTDGVLEMREYPYPKGPARQPLFVRNPSPLLPSPPLPSPAVYPVPPSAQFTLNMVEGVGYRAEVYKCYCL